MQQVATACGCGRATVYRHFANRDELLRAIRLRALSDCRAALPPAVFGKEPVRDALAAVLETLIPLLDRYRVLLDAPPPDLSDPAQRALTDAILQPLRQLVRRGQACGELDPQFPPDFAVAVFSGVLRAAREAVAYGTMAGVRHTPIRSSWHGHRRRSASAHTLSPRSPTRGHSHVPSHSRGRGRIADRPAGAPGGHRHRARPGGAPDDHDRRPAGPDADARRRRRPACVSGHDEAVGRRGPARRAGDGSRWGRRPYRAARPGTRPTRSSRSCPGAIRPHGLGSRGRGAARAGVLGSVNGAVHFHTNVPMLSIPVQDEHAARWRGPEAPRVAIAPTRTVAYKCAAGRVQWDAIVEQVRAARSRPRSSSRRRRSSGGGRIRQGVLTEPCHDCPRAR